MSGSAPAAASVGAALTGVAHGGNQVVAGARVYLFAAGSSGYGSASTSLLNPSSPGVTADTSGNGYVTTDAGGNWGITGDWSCVHATDQIYLLALGGNPGLASGTNNTAIALMAPLGTCSTITSSTFVIVDELKTVAATAALQQFMIDGLHVGSSGTNATGLANAFANVSNLVGLNNITAYTHPATGTGSVPQTRLHTLANILTSCVNTASGASPSCVTLFTGATVSGHAAPTDTLAASLNIAQNPGNNISSLYGLATASAPFQPTLSAAPHDWTIGITYSSTALPSPYGINNMAIDGQGNVWVEASENWYTPQYASVLVEYGPQGQKLSGTSGYKPGSISIYAGLTIDTGGNVWLSVNGPSTGALAKLNSSGVMATGFPIDGNIWGIAIDASGNAWATTDGAGGAGSTAIKEFGSTGSVLQTIQSSANLGPIAIDSAGSIWALNTPTGLVKYSSNGTLLSPATGYTGNGMSPQYVVAIDASGNAWSTNESVNLNVITDTGAGVSPPNGFTLLGNSFGTYSLAIDGANTAWTGVQGSPASIARFSGDGTALTPGTGYTNAFISSPSATAVDASGNVWVAGGTLVTQMLGVAAPVGTPLASALTAGKLGQLP